MKNVAKRRVGRPAGPTTGEYLKLKAFNLPISLIEKIQQEANLHYQGNASALAIESFSCYLTKQMDVR